MDVGDGDTVWSLRRAAERFQVSATTAERWADRYRRQGAAGMGAPPSGPRTSLRRTPRRIVRARVRHWLGPGPHRRPPGPAPSTVHRVLTRYGCPPLAHLDRATGRPVRRYEHPPGDLVHVDVKKLGNIPDGGGHRVHGRAIGRRNSAAHRDPARPRTVPGRPNLGYRYLHTAIDDHCRPALH
ncbi:hypothetical protein Acsp04_50890 [Actinomadura sp. NBRC 104425]|nr:hypothetical protein Acsp04_50890 [Actinomadura sp. NBRC 104425]